MDPRLSVGSRSLKAAHPLWTGKYLLLDIGRALTSHLSHKTAIRRQYNLRLSLHNYKLIFMDIVSLLYIVNLVLFKIANNKHMICFHMGHKTNMNNMPDIWNDLCQFI